MDDVMRRSGTLARDETPCRPETRPSRGGVCKALHRALGRSSRLRTPGALAAASVVAAFASGCDGAARSPSQPADPSAPVSVGVTCGEGARFIGEAFPCSAYVSDAGGRTRLVGHLPECSWASRDPSIVGLDPGFAGGVFVGVRGGSTDVTATYGGIVGTARVVIEAVDGIKVTAWTSSTARVGETAVLRQEVCHSLVSAAVGRVVVRAVSGTASIAESSLEVGGGGCSWRFLEFTVPAGASRICRTVSLELAARTIEAVVPPNAGDSWCITATN